MGVSWEGVIVRARGRRNVHMGRAERLGERPSCVRVRVWCKGLHTLRWRQQLARAAAAQLGQGAAQQGGDREKLAAGRLRQAAGGRAAEASASGRAAAAGRLAARAGDSRVDLAHNVYERDALVDLKLQDACWVDSEGAAGVGAGGSKGAPFAASSQTARQQRIAATRFATALGCPCRELAAPSLPLPSPPTATHAQRPR